MGLTVDEMLLVCAMLENACVDVIEMSGGTAYTQGPFPALGSDRVRMSITEKRLPAIR